MLTVVNASKLITAAEKKELKIALMTQAAQKKFSLSLYKLLYCTEPLQGRFESFNRVLQQFNIAKWTFISYFLFVTQPKRYLFIKPNVTQHASELCGFGINFKTEVNWAAYESTLRFSEYLFEELAALKPQNMNDVQSFITSIMAVKGDTKLKRGLAS